MSHLPVSSAAMQAIALHRAGRVPEAMAAYEAVLVEQPQAASVRHNLGLLHLGRGELAQAMQHLAQAWALDHGDEGWAQSLPMIGQHLLSHGCVEDARLWLTRAATRCPADPGVRANLARCTLRADLAPEVWDPVLQRSLLRHAPRESANYVFAIDVVGTCNLRCPTCPVGNSRGVGRAKGTMPLALYEQILDKIVAEQTGGGTPEIWLFNWGEPLLHPQLPQIIEATRRRHLVCKLSSNLNVNKGLREVVAAGPDELKISLSGFRPDAYARTHAGGDLNLVKGNMYLLRHWIDHHRVATKVWVGHHLYRGGEQDLAAVRALCDELGFAHHPAPAFFQPVERLLDVLDGHHPPDPVLDALIEHPSRYIPRLLRQRSPDHDCELRFNQTAINFDGSVALCCTVYDPGNMLGLSFLETPQRAIDEAKYRHPFCATCMGRGTSYALPQAERIQAPGV